jgi:gas vesicle protein
MTTKRVAREAGGALFLGGLLGAGAALILAPKSGRELRHEIAVRAGGAKDSMQNYLDRGKESLVSATRKSRDLFVDGTRSLVTARMLAGRKAFREGRHTYREEKERIIRAH